MKARARRSGPRSLRVLRYIRLLSAFVLASFLAQTTIAWAFPCCCADESSESCPDGDGDERCSCPVACGACCAGNALPTIPVAPASAVFPAAFFVASAAGRDEQDPPRVDPSEILRVPKQPRA